MYSWSIINQIVKRRPFIHIVGNLVLHRNGVNGNQSSGIYESAGKQKESLFTSYEIGTIMMNADACSAIGSTGKDNYNP